MKLSWSCYQLVRSVFSIDHLFLVPHQWVIEPGVSMTIMVGHYIILDLDLYVTGNDLDLDLTLVDPNMNLDKSSLGLGSRGSCYSRLTNPGPVFPDRFGLPPMKKQDLKGDFLSLVNLAQYSWPPLALLLVALDLVPVNMLRIRSLYICCIHVLEVRLRYLMGLA